MGPGTSSAAASGSVCNGTPDPALLGERKVFFRARYSR